MDRKMMEKPAVAVIGDEELGAVTGATGLVLPSFPSISVVASPVTIAQANVNTTTQLAIGNLGATVQAASSVGSNSASVSYGG